MSEKATVIPIRAGTNPREEVRRIMDVSEWKDPQIKACCLIEFTTDNNILFVFSTGITKYEMVGAIEQLKMDILDGGEIEE